MKSAATEAPTAMKLMLSSRADRFGFTGLTTSTAARVASPPLYMFMAITPTIPGQEISSTIRPNPEKILSPTARIASMNPRLGFHAST